jgi:hypothetical protein
VAIDANQDDPAAIRRIIQRRGKYLTEELAGFLISCQLGHGFRSEHIGEFDSSSDCRITRNGVPFGLVEVMTHKDQQREALLTKVINADGSERLPLPDGVGAWTCEMTSEARFDDLTMENFCELIGCLRSEGIDDVHLDYSWSNGPESVLLRRLGLRSIRRLEVDGDFVFRHMPIVGGVIDDSKDLIADFVEGIVNDPTIEEKLQRLSLRADGLHRYFCIVVGSASGLSVEWRMNGTSMTSPVPERPISLPHSVDSVWVMSQEVGRVLGFGTSGWTEYQFPAKESPWWESLDLAHAQAMASLRRSYHDALARNRNRRNS